MRSFDWIQELYLKEIAMKKSYTGPYYVVSKNGKEVFTYKKDVGRHVGRNPFNTREYYNGWIYEFDYVSLPECLF